MGSTKTMISRRGAAMLGLTPHRMSNVTMYGIGGSEVPSETIVDDLKIGNAVAHKVDLMVAGQGLTSDKYVGLLGRDFLSQADIEFDFANGLLRIIKAKGCDGDQVVYWNKPYSLATIVPSNDPDRVKVYVSLNSEKAVAMLETGASTSFVNGAMAERAGVKPTAQPAAPDGPTTGAAGGGAVATYIATFSKLGVGDEQISNAKLLIANLYQGDERTETGTRIGRVEIDKPDMLLGMDFIRAHHIYVARSQGKMYFSYNGGPIFQTVRTADSPPGPQVAPGDSRP
jgi:predicted aspartyl protease